MAQYACKLLTDEGDFYVGFCNTIDQFISLADPNPVRVAQVMSRIYEGEEYTADQVCAVAEGNVINMRSATYKQALLLVEKLKRGEVLTDDEAAKVYVLDEFLDATVAPHQNGFKSQDYQIDSWIEELGLRKKIPAIKKYDRWEILTDRACYPAFQAYRHRSFDSDVINDIAKAIPEQRMLAGRYVSLKASFAGLTSAPLLTPVQIVNKFFKRFFGK